MNFLWLMSLPLLGEEAYRQRAKKRIRFFYKGSEEELTPDKLQPGQRLSIAMGEHIKTTLFAKRKCTENPLGRYGDGIERRNPA